MREDKLTAVGTSHAKIILIGEHSVVYGQPAIAFPLSAVSVRVTVTANNHHGVLIKSSLYTGPLVTAPATLAGTKHLVAELLRGLPADQRNITLNINSNIPAERGMGSSAAVAVAIIRAIFRFYGWTLNQDVLLHLANISEIDTHKNPSGLDAITAANASPIWMIRDHEIKKIPVTSRGYLVICDSGILGQTKEAIAIVRQKMERDPQGTTQHLYNLGQLTAQVRTLLAQDEVIALGQALGQAHQELKELGVSLPAIDDLITASYAHGSLGSKLTGGGRGGCFICLAADRPTAEKLADYMKTQGIVQTWIEPLATSKE
ncbi:mevalonate kinase [Ligilactobacillus saerimneri]|uniref:mevalonate kinase n=1 Tax=Ligilactobacillus saerimneri TaxID=228229 RepID=UPI0024B1DD2B|nr:mevalonate kinase [Ligilactobacillus saerimneri]MDI9205733.1 mevalonate kinase [Ligilactobacillus saerimneri]